MCVCLLQDIMVVVGGVYVYALVCMWVCAHECRHLRRLEWPLDLELQAAVTCTISVQVTNVRLSANTLCPFNG